MAKYSTCPTLFDNVIQISISNLKKWNYLEPYQIKNGIIRWSIGEMETAKINIRVSTYGDFVELYYSYSGEPVRYKIRLVSLPSNIGKGKVWYFECPQTRKLCRKLYLVGGYFFHREAFRGYYEGQTKSKKIREQNRLIEMIFGTEKLYEQLHGKYFRQSYNGKPTKKYIRLMSKIQRAKNVSASEIERILLPRGCCL
jgi:hypothetical protein